MALDVLTQGLSEGPDVLDTNTITIRRIEENATMIAESRELIEMLLRLRERSSDPEMEVMAIE